MTPSSTHLGLRPRPQIDETLSSFLLRLARNHAATPHELGALTWPGLDIWPRDIDRTATDRVIECVAQAVGVPLDRIRDMTLRGLVEGMGRPVTPAGIQTGILPVGVYHRMRRRHGQQFCPDCLRSDPPYLRRQWRLEFVCACPVHRRRLADGCSQCDAPFIPHRNDALLERRCHCCGASLVDCRRVVVDDEAMALQGVLITLLVDAAPGDVPPCWRPWTDPASRPALFDGVHRLCRLLKFAADGLGVQPRRPGLRWDFLRVAQREAVLGVAGRWIRDWPESFFTWAEAHRVSQERLSEYGPWPAWIQKSVQQLPSRPRRRHKRAAMLAGLRAEYGNIATYRMARAKALLDGAARRQEKR